MESKTGILIAVVVVLVLILAWYFYYYRQPASCTADSGCKRHEVCQSGKCASKPKKKSQVDNPGPPDVTPADQIARSAAGPPPRDPPAAEAEQEGLTSAYGPGAVDVERSRWFGVESAS